MYISDHGPKIFQTQEAGPRGNAEGWRRPRRDHRSCPPRAEARPGFTSILIPMFAMILFKIIIKYVADICAFLQFRLL